MSDRANDMSNDQVLDLLKLFPSHDINVSFFFLFFLQAIVEFNRPGVIYGT